jgi:D-arabinose 1-dehydrogenase-like Zn-dependent alcohol dehydrogenase
LTFHQIQYGLSVHSWPSGHTIDSQEAIQFTELENINCMVEKFPLEKANDAYGKFFPEAQRGTPIADSGPKRP